MAFIFFNDILKMLGKKLNYDAVSNLAGNSFAKNAFNVIQDSNPMYKPPKLGRGMMSLIESVAAPKTEEQKKKENESQVNQIMKEFSWATEDMFK